MRAPFCSTTCGRFRPFSACDDRAVRLEKLCRGRQPLAGNAVGNRLGDMDAAGLRRAVEIGQRAGNLHDAVIGARRKLHPVGGIAQQLQPSGIDIRDLFDQCRRAVVVGGDALYRELCVTLGLDRAGGSDTLALFTRTFT